MASYYVTTSGSDANAGTSEGAAWATPGYAMSQVTGGDTVYIKQGTYTLTSATQNVSGGAVLVPDDVIFEGYQTSAGDRAAFATISAGAVAPSYIVQLASSGVNSNRNACYAIKVDGNGQSVNGFDNGSGLYNSALVNCLADDCTIGFQTSRYGFTYGCSATNCTSGFYGGGPTIHCFAKNCSNEGFNTVSQNRWTDFQNCIASGCGTGFQLGNSWPQCVSNCVAYNSTADGFAAIYGDLFYARACIAVNNGGYGFNYGSGTGQTMLVDCASYGNTSGRKRSTATPDLEIRSIVLTSDPFTDAANDDFTLNNTAGAGADCRQIQASMLAGVNVSLDIGAINSVTAAAGGETTPKHPLGRF